MNNRRSHSQNNESKTSLIATIIIVLILLGWMLTSTLNITLTQEETKLAHVDSSEIVFGGEFVKMGNFATPTRHSKSTTATETQNTEESAHEGTDLQNSGMSSAEQPEIVTSERQSPAKVDKKPQQQKTGPSKEELAERERIRREREQAQKSKLINSGMKNTFNKPGNTTTQIDGSPQGNSTVGISNGSPGFSLFGRTAEGWGKPSSAFGGTITIRVKVNRQGHVISATYAGGSGSAAAQQNVRQSCIQAARQSRFSVDENAPAEQSGTITWTFR
ncbi:MAG: hypothetical protein NC343_07635 [Muribaculum sp.]|nr:hypothetical protein [Muribaculaceae bacterium]MCM1081606.1 hypothetical protein [Muribaculum sp.]